MAHHANIYTIILQFWWVKTHPTAEFYSVKFK